MRLAFHNEARYPDFDEAYGRYVSGSRSRTPVDDRTYRRVVREYCGILAGRLEKEGMVDLPLDMGMLAVAEIRRKARYKDNKFVGYGRVDWLGGGGYDGSPTALGVVYIPSRRKTANLRSYGFVANRRLYKRIKALYESGDAEWSPMEFNDDMI